MAKVTNRSLRHVSADPFEASSLLMLMDHMSVASGKERPGPEIKIAYIDHLTME